VDVSARVGASAGVWVFGFGAPRGHEELDAPPRTQPLRFLRRPVVAVLRHDVVCGHLTEFGGMERSRASARIKEKRVMVPRDRSRPDVH
jgi:hypothetical protein